MKIWGRLSSINVRKVVWAAQEAATPFTRVDAGADYGIVKTPDYQQMNPNALVPTLQHGALILWESNVIVRYLATLCPASTLLPSDTATRFLAEQWMDWQQTTFSRAGREAFIQLIRTPAEQRRDDLVAQSAAATAPLLQVIDRHLANQRFMAGDDFSMADIPLGCEMHRWFGLPLAHDLAATPHLHRWYAALRERAASRGVLDQPLT
jgi:glutathione S-transferase